MDNNNRRKNELLGMSHGTAVHRLRKSIMFQMAKRLGDDICFRCGEKIEDLNDLSVDHKRSWQSAKDPREAFFDLKNIAFSHLHCNVSAAERVPRGPVLTEAQRKETRERWYRTLKSTEEYKRRNRDRQRKRYATDADFREYHRKRMKNRSKKRSGVA